MSIAATIPADHTPTAIQPDSASPAITLARMAGLILAITDIARELERLSEEMDGPLLALIERQGLTFDEVMRLSAYVPPARC